MIGLVTGASRGLGLELVKQGLEGGHTVIACWLGVGEDDTDLKHLIEKYGNQIKAIVMDVTDTVAVSKAVDVVDREYGHLDFIINSAGVLFESKYDISDPIATLDIDMLRKTLEVNTIGPAIVLKAFIPLIYKSDNPCIINITSEAGHLSPEGYVYLAYSVSKHAVNMYTQKIVNYLNVTPDKANIRVFMVHPGRMQTIMGAENAQILPSESAKGIYQIINKTINPKLDIPFINYKGEPMPY